MQAAVIDENQWQAREKYAEYLKAVKERHSAEYEALKNAYREISRGNQVIDLIETFRRTGTDHLHRPRLAVARADGRLCWFRWRSRNGPNHPTFSIVNDFWSGRQGTRRISLPLSTFATPFDLRSRISLRAVIPTIPPSLTPAGKLNRYFILWEAEWESVPIDPMLLAPLGKNLYRVLATWDLTPLERAVLSDRL